ncbi:Multidrug effflux MFS transporter [Vibrio neptunius]|uniref:multidrug effflux MFS transporter n=1 Tax=Vibrio neptunius TaxID=170651 RepID=UPI001C5C841B|nr:multidrug effflux MFS transporter [Vibrio neptunius]QXX09413.1 multidrug effflux MFS transporter [Vibrio neptunius]
MQPKPSLWLMFTMLMFPQVVETIYSPALHSIAHSFSVTNAQASQTLSVYFIAFALGVVFWGVAADQWGRRPAMIGGITVYGLSTLIALLSTQFEWLITARAASAFGIAVGSVVTQTMLRDVFDGEALGKVFSLMSMGIAISPVIGMSIGGQLVQAGGHNYVFSTLLAMAVILVVYNLWKLPETQREKKPLNLCQLGTSMFKDGHIWYSTIMIAVFNIALFSYYQLGAFIFTKLGFNSAQFGYSGIILGIGTLIGSYLNKYLLSKHTPSSTLVGIAVTLLCLGSLGVYLTQNSIYFIIMMMLVVMAFGIAIPNVISAALKDYKHYTGSSGAILGLIYYMQIGIGLVVAGQVQQLGTVLLGCSMIALVSYTVKSYNQYHLTGH